MKTTIIGCLLALSLPGTAMAQSAAKPAKPWPREVQAYYDNLKAECKAEGGKFIVERDRFATETEVTNDKKSDWVLELDATRCSTSGYSAWCGSGGCSMVVMGSGPKGLTEILDATVRGWSAVDLGRGRKGLDISVHGTACGSVGADVCVQTLSWDGRKWVTVKSLRGEQAIDPNATYVPEPMPPQHDAKWVFAGQGAQAIAAVTDHPEFAAVGLRCQPGGGIYMTVVPMRKLALPPAGRPLLLDFTGSTEGISATQSLMQEPGKPDFSGPLVPPLHALIGGRDTGLSLLVSTTNGDEWEELTYFSLGGSTAALRSLEKACAGAASGAAASQASTMTPVGPLGIVPGYYVDEFASCSAPGFDSFYYDGKRFALLRGNGPEEYEKNEVGPLGKVRKLGKVWELTDWGMQIAVLSPTRIQPTIQDTGPPMRWCAADQIPANFRVR